MKRKLILINPVNPCRSGLTINESSRFPPINLGIVAALTPESWDVEIIDENWMPFQYCQADLVGITAFTASVNRGYEIAAEYRRRGVPVIMGGIHASMCPDEALRYVDAVVIGEAESVWPKVIVDHEQGRLQRRYQGEWTNLINSVQPRRNLFHPGYRFASVQTSRGCPLNCSFCSVTAFNGQRFRRRSIEEVLDELETIPQKMIFFVDDNIVGYSREACEEALALFRGMVERKIDKWWFCQASINFGDDEDLLEWAAQAGCKMVFLGLESDEVESLEEVHKRLNVRYGIDSYADTFRRIQRAGIAVLGAFIFGMDHDTPNSLINRAEYMIRSGIDVMQLTYLTPLPGTPLFNQIQEEDRLLYSNYPEDWQHYDMTEIVFKPKRIDLSIIINTINGIQQRMYAWPIIINKAISTFFRTRRLITTLFALNSNINYRNVSLSRDIESI